MQQTVQKFITWDEISNDCRTVVRLLKKRKKKFDVIVPLIRGGLVPASIISHISGVNPIVPVIWQTRDGLKEKGKKEFEKKVLSKYKKILIVDDLIDSGKTLTEVFDFVNGSDAKNAKTEVHSAVLLYNTSREHKTNTCLESTVFSRSYTNTKAITYWWNFPWEWEVVIGY